MSTLWLSSYLEALMPSGLRVCSQQGCWELTDSGRCPEHRRVADRKRGTAAQRGYGNSWRGTRHDCLIRDPLCTCLDNGHGHDGRACLAPSGVADHWPTSRRDLVAQGVKDPDALHRLRGICTSCHNKHTAVEQPGGWHAADQH